MNKLFYKIGFNTLVQSAGKVISVALSVVTVLLLTRYLGTAGYGNFTLVFTYVSFFSVIADFGLQTAMVRELSQGESSKKYYGSFLSLKILLSGAAALLAFILLLFFPYSVGIKVGILLGICAVSVSNITTYGSIIFQSRLRLDLVTLVDVITKIFTVAFIVLCTILKLNFFFIVSTVFWGNLIGLALTFFLIKENLHFHYEIKHMKQVLIASFPIGITAFLGLAYFKIDTILLSILKSSTDVGLYTLAYKVLENILIVWGFYMASTYPLLAKLKGENNVKQLRILFKNSLFVAVGLSIPIIILGIIFAPLVIQILGGKGFMESASSLKILLFSFPFLFINNLFTDFFFALKQDRAALLGMVVSLIINVLLNLYFIPMYGFIGASYITVIGAIIFTIYCIMQIVLQKEKFLLYER